MLLTCGLGAVTKRHVAVAAAVVAAVKAAGLTDIEWYLRGPHEWRGETTQRLYILARRA